MESSNIITQYECLKVIKRYVHTSQFELLEWSIRPLSSEPVGLIGEHFTLKVSIRVRNPTIRQEQVQHLQFFAKAVPQNGPGFTNFVEELGAFQKEVDIFRKLFVDFKSVQVGGNNNPWTCECYYTRPDMLVLEDLTTYGFRIFSNRESMDLKHSALVMKTLARFHATSIVFEERQENSRPLDELYPNIFFETFFVDTPGHPGNDLFKVAVNSILYLTEILSAFDKYRIYLDFIKDKLPRVCHDMLELLKTSTTYKNVACHGDLWANNIFFLYDGDTPVEARLVDFQLLRYTPPAHDVMCFLYLSTSRAFRLKHLQSLQTIYHEHLTKCLLEHGLDARKLLPWEQFTDSCQHLKRLGIISAAVYSQTTTMRGEDTANIHKSADDFHRFMRVDRHKELYHSVQTDPVYRSRMAEVVEELIEECVLTSDSQ